MREFARSFAAPHPDEPVIEGCVISKQVCDPRVTELVNRLPLVGKPSKEKPRKFRLYCECFEWTFTQVQRDARPLNNHFVDALHLVEAVDRQAQALWFFLHPEYA